MSKSYFFDGIKSGVPICLGYFSVSMAYGVSASANGLSVFQATLISITSLTSAGQFAGTNLMGQHAGMLEIIIAMLVINSRYFLMGMALSQKLDKKVTFFDRLLISYGITDEIFAVAIGQKKKLQTSFMLGLISVSALGWAAGTFLGAAASQLLPDVISNALTIALYAMFIAIIIPPSKKEKSVALTCLLSIALSALFYYTPVLSKLSGGYTLILITVAVSALMAWLFPRKEEENV